MLFNTEARRKKLVLSLSESLGSPGGTFAIRESGMREQISPEHGAGTCSGDGFVLSAMQSQGCFSRKTKPKSSMKCVFAVRP